MPGKAGLVEVESGSGTRGHLFTQQRKQMEEEEFERRCKCKRQLEGAEGAGGMRGWLEDEEEEAERMQQNVAGRGCIGGCCRRTCWWRSTTGRSAGR